jgi:hypothetical protein
MLAFSTLHKNWLPSLRLQQWCADATVQDGQRDFKALFVRQEDFKKYQPKDFAGLVAVST